MNNTKLAGLACFLVLSMVSAFAGNEIITVGRIHGNSDLTKLIDTLPEDGIVLEHFTEILPWDYTDYALVRRNSRVVLARDDQFLYFLGIAERDPAYPLIPTTAKSSWGDQHLRADSFRLELTRSPKERQADYEICLNVAPLVIVKDNKLNKTAALPVENAVVRVDGNTWTIAAKIPFSLIGGAPKENEKPGFILHRWLPAGQKTDLGEGWAVWSDLGGKEERWGKGYIPYSTMVFDNRVPFVRFSDLGWGPEKKRTVKGTLRNTSDKKEKYTVLLADWNGVELNRLALDLPPGKTQDFTLGYQANGQNGLYGEITLRVSDAQNRTVYQSPRRRVLRKMQKDNLPPVSCPITVIPQPQMVEKLARADFLVKDKMPLVLSGSGCEQEKFSATDFAEFLQERCQVATTIIEAKTSANQGIVLQIVPGDKIEGLKQVPARKREQGYVLKTSRERVVITAETQQGLFYGLQTLKQLLQKTENGWIVPGVSIIDWPDLPIRGIHGQINGTRTSWEETCKLMALFKVNQLLGDLNQAKYAKPYFIEVIPQKQFYAWGAPGMAPQEIREQMTEKGGGPGGAICPVAEGIDKVVKKGLEDLAAQSLGAYIHVGCDEPNVGMDPRTAKVIEEKGRELLAKRFPNLQDEAAKSRLVKLYGSQWVDGNYVGNVVLRQAVAIGKTPMVYAEALGSETALSFIGDLKDKVVLEPWDYMPRGEYGAACFLSRHGFRVVGLPAIYWRDPLPESHYYQDNVLVFARNMFDLGQEGLLATQWGGPDLVESRWYGFVFAAEYMWSVDRPGTMAEFRKHFGEQFFGDSRIGSAFELLNQVRRDVPESAEKKAMRISAIRHLLGSAPKHHQKIARVILEQCAEQQLGRLEGKMGIPPARKVTAAAGYQQSIIPVSSIKAKGTKGAPPDAIVDIPLDVVTGVGGRIAFDRGTSGSLDITFPQPQKIGGIGFLQDRNDWLNLCSLRGASVQYQKGTEFVDCPNQKAYDGNLANLDKPAADWTLVTFDQVETSVVRIVFQLDSGQWSYVNKLELYRNATEPWMDFAGYRVSESNPTSPAANLFDKNDRTTWMPTVPGNGKGLPCYWIEQAFEKPRKISEISFINAGNHGNGEQGIARTEAYSWDDKAKTYVKAPYAREPKYSMGYNELFLIPVETKRIRLAIYPKTPYLIRINELEFCAEPGETKGISQEEIDQLLK